MATEAKWKDGPWRLWKRPSCWKFLPIGELMSKIVVFRLSSGGVCIHFISAMKAAWTLLPSPLPFQWFPTTWPSAEPLALPPPGPILVPGLHSSQAFPLRHWFSFPRQKCFYQGRCQVTQVVSCFFRQNALEWNPKEWLDLIIPIFFTQDSILKQFYPRTAIFQVVLFIWEHF